MAFEVVFQAGRRFAGHVFAESIVSQVPVPFHPRQDVGDAFTVDARFRGQIDEDL